MADTDRLMDLLAKVGAALVTAIAVGAFGFAWRLNTEIVTLRSEVKSATDQTRQHALHWQYDAMLLKNVNELRVKHDLALAEFKPHD